TGNSTIRKVTPAGVVSTIAGFPGTTGGADGTNSIARFNHPASVAADRLNNLYVADTANSTIRKIALVGTNRVVTTIAGLAGTPGSADGTNGSARFANPVGVAVDSAGNVYVADTQSGAVRQVTPTGANWVVTTITNVAASPNGIALDSAGNIFVPDTFNGRIFRIARSGPNWVLTTAAMSFATAIFGLAVDSATNIY